MITKGDLIEFSGPEVYFQNGWMWAHKSFLSGYDVSRAFTIHRKTIYMVADTHPGVIGICDWYKLMNPHGKFGWWLNAEFVIKADPITHAYVIPTVQIITHSALQR